MKAKPQGAIIDIQRKPDGTQDQEPSDDSDSGINAAAADLIRAVHAKDEMGVASAIRAAFDILQSEPTEESSEPPEGDIQ